MRYQANLATLTSRIWRIKEMEHDCIQYSALSREART
jgi:hypothetical protein